MANEYFESADKSGFEVKILKVREMKFDPVLHNGYHHSQQPEKDLLNAQELIQNCDHIVIFTPVWWLGFPALLKGFFDRTFLPGFVFGYDKTKKKFTKLMRNKTIRVVYTQSGSFFRSFFRERDAFWKHTKYGIIGFCGFKCIARTFLTRVQGIENMKRRMNFIEKVRRLGEKGK